jgi:regulatory protein YycI of two-component signal transduction system YycFG
VSALTKIFVVLNVLLSIVLAAGVVVWVNRSENFVKSATANNARLKADEARIASLKSENDLLGAEQTQIRQTMQHQIDDGRKSNDQLQASVADKDTQVAQLNANLAQATAAQKSANDALTVAQKMVDTQNTTIADLRKSGVDQDKKNAELSFAVNDWTNKFEVVNRQERDDREQITQLQSDNRKYQELLHKNGIAENSTPEGESLTKVSGVIRSAQKIGGVPYATIDVGGADAVTKGMRFRVIDPKAADPFLGYLIVDRVEPRQAFGHLTGPHIDEVHEGVEVRTQL